MKEITIPFSADAASLWAGYLTHITALVKIQSALFTGYCEVHPEINSIQKHSQEGTYVGFSNDIDWITIDDGKEDGTTSRRVFINFPSISDENKGLELEFLEGENNDENFRYKELSEVRFDAVFLGMNELYIEIGKWFKGGEINTSILLNHPTKLF